MKDSSKKPRARAKRPRRAVERVASVGGYQPRVTARAGVGRGADNLEAVRATWTPLYAWNYASQIGGDPLRRMSTIYALSRSGKSLRLYQRYRTHLDAGGVVFHVPAERGEDPDFVRGMLGPHYDSDCFIVSDPDVVFSFGRVSEDAHWFAGEVSRMTQEALADGHDDWVGGMYGLDSLVAVIPDEMVEDLERDARYDDYVKGGGTKHEYGDASSADMVAKRIRDNNYWMRLAQHFGAWFWSINQRFYANNVTGVWVTQCSQTGTYKNWRGESVPIYGPKLGRGLYEPHAMLEYIEVDSKITEDVGDSVRAMGHTIRLKKNKCGSIPEGRERVVRFWMRKDEVELDHARNLLEGCIYAEQLTGRPVIQLAGSYYKYDGQTIAQGRGKTLHALRSDPGLFDEIAGALQRHERETRQMRRGTMGLQSEDDKSQGSK